MLGIRIPPGALLTFEVHVKVSIPTYNKNLSERKISVRIDKWDTHSLDHTLAHIIHPALVQFRENLSGYPGEKGMTMAKWEKILDKMIFSFGETMNDVNAIEKFSSGDYDWIVTKLEDGGEEWQKGPNATYKFDTRGYKAYNKKLQEGFELFGKYYSNLWD